MTDNNHTAIGSLLKRLKDLPQTWTVVSWGAYINTRYVGSLNKRSHVGTVAELVKRLGRRPKNAVIDRVRY